MTGVARIMATENPADGCNPSLGRSSKHGHEKPATKHWEWQLYTHSGPSWNRDDLPFPTPSSHSWFYLRISDFWQWRIVVNLRGTKRVSSRTYAPDHAYAIVAAASICTHILILQVNYNE
jgi:hypothetical protein